jgi:hypothetical protein
MLISRGRGNAMDSKDHPAIKRRQQDQNSSRCLTLTGSCILLVLRAPLNNNDITAQGA